MVLKEREWKNNDKLEVLNYSIGLRGILESGERPYMKDKNWEHILKA